MRTLLIMEHGDSTETLLRELLAPLRPDSILVVADGTPSWLGAIVGPGGARVTLVRREHLADRGVGSYPVVVLDDVSTDLSDDENRSLFRHLVARCDERGHLLVIGPVDRAQPFEAPRGGPFWSLDQFGEWLMGAGFRHVDVTTNASPDHTVITAVRVV